MTKVRRVLALREIIQAKLKEIHPNVFYEDASTENIFPRLVCFLDDSIDDGIVEQFSLEVDAWDCPEDGSTMTLEQLISDVDLALHRQVIVRDGLSFRFYRLNRRTIRDNDKRIKRRQYVYEIKVMGVNR